MRIPYVDLARQNRAALEDAMERVRRVLEHGFFILGPEVEELEEKLAGYIGVKNVIGVNSGTDALVLALRAHGVGPGDEVITVSHTFLSTAAAICLVGATPVFADIDPATMLIDPESVVDSITPSSKAILPVHLNGYPCDMESLSAIAKDHDLILVEDCAQALGAKIEGRSVGTWGTGCFSLHPLKVLSACGDAGFIVSDSPDFATKIRQLRNNGLLNRDECAQISGNSRLDGVQAAILLAKFPYLDQWVDARNANAEAYRAALDGKVFLPPSSPNVRCCYSSFVIRLQDRDSVLEGLLAKEVDAKVHYPIPVHRQRPYRRFARGPLPVTDKTVRSIMSLPCSPELSEEQRGNVIKRLSALLA